MLLFNLIVVSRILVNCQTWTRLRKKNCKSITICVQAGLKRILMTATSTPNCGVYLELGILPIEYVIKKRKMIFCTKYSKMTKTIFYTKYKKVKNMHINIKKRKTGTAKYKILKKNFN